jgi:hypothetical protein
VVIRDPEQNFTLVEVLVTLVLLSMVAAIVFGSLGQVLDARARLRPYLDKSEETALVASWFRQTVQALIADYDTGKNRFTASANAFSGLTASPLLGPAGTPTAFTWALNYDPVSDLTVLQYGEKPSDTVEIARWARSESWAISSRLTEAEATLRQARADEPSRIAYDYLNHDTITVSPVDQARAELDKAEAERERNSMIEESLDKELAVVARKWNAAKYRSASPWHK